MIASHHIEPTLVTKRYFSKTFTSDNTKSKSSIQEKYHKNLKVCNTGENRKSLAPDGGILHYMREGFRGCINREKI